MSIEQPIPLEWRKAVITVLRSGDENRIQVKNQARRDWESTFPNTWPYHRAEAIVRALEVDGIYGRHILDMVPSCDAYEFWFFFDERKILGKIGLLPSGNLIIIFSSHIPRKGEKL